MNAVVQQILDSGTNEDADKEVDGTTRVIDLTDEESAKNDSATTQVQNLAKIPVDTNMMQKILETVEKQGSVSACNNLLSFQKPEKYYNNCRIIYLFSCVIIVCSVFVSVFSSSILYTPCDRGFYYILCVDINVIKP